jgi:transcription initiation factor TFIIIB Brf1 subunit/transcription initiation factor TFIIB
MLDACPECGESELAWDGYDHYQGDEGGQCVCQNCGAVVALNNLTGDDPRYATSAACGQPSTADDRKAHAKRSRTANCVAVGRRNGMKSTERIAQCMECSASMTSEAIAMFERFYCHNSFRLRSTSVKHVLAACSVYIVCRRHSWPITLAGVAAMAGCEVYAMQALKNELMAVFDDLSDVRPPDLMEQVEAQCAQAGFSAGTRDTVTKVIALCRDAWICDGRRPEIVIAAASFVAWQSEDPSKRWRVAASTFCLQHRMIQSTRVNDLAKEIKSTLCQLAEQIPWIGQGGVDKKKIVWFVPDVLKYRCALEADTRERIRQNNGGDESHGASLDSAVAHSPELDSVGSGTDTVRAVRIAGDTGESSVNRPDVRTFSSVETASSTSSTAAAAAAAASPDCVYDAVAVGLHQQDVLVDTLFQPAAYKTPRPRGKRPRDNDDERRRINHPDLDSSELGIYDIPDDKVHLYFKRAFMGDADPMRYNGID